jgi:signal transduction histidine kinase/FixJ family two-component response regulator
VDSRQRILIVDDELGPREALRMILKAHYDVSTARNGPEGLEQVRQTPPDVVFLDIKMPGMSGMEVLKAIKQCDPGIEVVMMTAYASLETAREAVAHSASDYLIKPFTKADVEKAVSKALARRAAQTGPHHEMRALLAQMRTLAEASTQGTTPDQLLANLTAMLAQGQQAVQAAATVLYLHDPARHTLVCQETLGVPQALHHTVQSATWQSMLTQVLEPLQPLYLPALPGTEQTAAWQRHLQTAGWEAGIILPIVAGRQALGALVFLYDASHTPHADWRTLGQAFADLLALAMQVRQRYYAAQRETSQQGQRVAQLSILREITRVILENLVLPDMLSAIAEQLQVGLGYSGIALWLRAQDSLEMQLVHRNGLASGWQPPDVASAAALEVEQIEGLQVIRAPIVLKATAIGMVELVRDQQDGPVTAFESELIRMVLDHLGLAVNNAQLHEQLLRSEKLRALGEMAAGVAHNFNNMLTTTLGYTQLLLEEYTREDSVRAGLRAIEKATLDAAQVVRRIQAFAKGKTTAECLHTDVTLLIKEVIEATRPIWKEQAERQGKWIDVSFDPEPLPLLPCRAAELREVLTNLLLNAVEAMPSGGTLAIRTYQDGRFACIAVTDTGTGMTEEVRQRIFDPFFTTKKGKGTGLGLSVSHMLIKGHGGEIDVHSTPGQGSTFVIKLPVNAPVTAVETD